MIRVELFAGLEYAKGNGNELAHGGANDLHFVFAVASQALTEVTDDRVVSLGGHCWQKERLTNSGVSGL